MRLSLKSQQQCVFFMSQKGTKTLKIYTFSNSK